MQIIVHLYGRLFADLMPIHSMLLSNLDGCLCFQLLHIYHFFALGESLNFCLLVFFGCIIPTDCPQPAVTTDVTAHVLPASLFFGTHCYSALLNVTAQLPSIQ